MAQDYDKAMALLQKVDPQLAAQAEYSLAVRYALGNDIEKNQALAQKWFKESCDSGHPDACIHVN